MTTLVEREKTDGIMTTLVERERGRGTTDSSMTTLVDRLTERGRERRKTDGIHIFNDYLIVLTESERQRGEKGLTRGRWGGERPQFRSLATFVTAGFFGRPAILKVTYLRTCPECVLGFQKLLHVTRYIWYTWRLLPEA